MDEVEKRFKVGELKHGKYITLLQVFTALFVGVLLSSFLSSFIEETGISQTYLFGIFIVGIVLVVILCGWRLNSIEKELLELKVDKRKVDEIINNYEKMHSLLGDLNTYANLNQWKEFNETVKKVRKLRDKKPSVFDKKFNEKFLNKTMSVSKEYYHIQFIVAAIKEIELRIEEITDRYEL